MPKNLLALKKTHAKKFLAIKNEFFKNQDPIRFFKSHINLKDELLKDIWLQIFNETSQNLTLIAVGGYGRKELYPYSDIDLAILHEAKLKKNTQVQVELFVQACWDLGLKSALSIRSIKTIKNDIKDVTIATNLIEGRLLQGDQELFKRYKDILFKSLNLKKFILQKCSEQELRHKKFNSNSYLLEPNIKESKGCLRDLHYINWLTRASYEAEKPEQALTTHIIDKKSFLQLNLHFKNLARIRIVLHFIAENQEDRLLFDYQNILAKTLKIKYVKNKKASEILMQSIYKSIRYINILNEIITKKFIFKLDPKLTNNPGLYIHKGLIEVNLKGKLNINDFIFEALALFQNKYTLKGFGHSLLFAIFKSMKIDNSFIKTKSNQEKFLKILSAKQKVNRALRLMNQINFLGSFVRPFRKIISLMQHDLFHIYTVDEHTLNVIENIRRYSKPKLKHESPECHDVFAKIRKPQVLYIAALFHDIGKGQGGDHSLIGGEIANRYCKLIGLDPEDTQTISWLVRNHLVMSNTAQKLDLADPTVIRDFSTKMQSQKNLDLLFLLTNADIKGTSPKVWSEWKAVLLKNLYKYSSIYLQKDVSDSSVIKSRKAEAEKLLKKYAIDKKIIHTNWGNFDQSYFLKFEAEDIAWQSRILLTHLNSKTPIVRVRHNRHGQGIDILIYLKDQEDIFLHTAAFLYDIHCKILQAKVYTTPNGFALNSFTIEHDDKNLSSYKIFFENIELRLTEILKTKKIQLKRNINLGVSRQAEHHKIKKEIQIEKISEKNRSLLIKLADRPGLVFSIAKIISENKINLINAKITTMGDRAEDTFLLEITTNTNEKKFLRDLDLALK